ncbi:hypothetical protein HPB48_022166 [Haemaphysalis longicornis]|uniref:Uncharacterized protein n=1 Tax=Haemaphysalis longicornis TaxID=44386 RepID=A0A9J6FK50_HAELO|nr:hypothetical protein HPB48_022166 [Haemaphysalis longicornis]
MLIALLQSFGGGISEVEAGVAKVTVTIRRLLEDDGSGEIRQLPRVKAAALRVFAWATEHREDSPTDHYGEDWPPRIALDGSEDDAVSVMGPGTLLHLLVPANYLEIKRRFFDREARADPSRCTTPEMICQTFHIEDDLFPEHDRQENE